MKRPAPLPDPMDLGFPPKFQRWYDDQLEALDRILLNPKRFTALAMPTGSGKSLTGVAAALLHKDVKRAIYLTSTKGLQDQLAQDFSSLGLHDLRGARNYPCLMIEPLSDPARPFAVGCDEGPCRAEVWCSKAPDKEYPELQPVCFYYGAVWQARRTDLVSTNYAMYFSSQEYSQGLGEFDLVILDEAHDAAGELESFLAIELVRPDLRYAGLRPLARNLEEWRDWAVTAVKAVSTRLRKLGTSSTRDVQERLHLKTLQTKLTRLAAIDPKHWVLDDDGIRARFCPLKVGAYAETYLFRGVKHVVLLSATLTHKTLADLGIGRDLYSFWEAPSRFPVLRRPVYSLETTPPVRVDSRMDADDVFFWLQRIDRIIGPRRRLGWKGIIHTVSYQRMRELLARSDHKDIMITHDAGSTREAVREFKESDGPRLLVSPSVMTGYDFPDDECRFQIISKVPLPDSRDPVTKARSQADKQYAGHTAMQKLVQACGRGMRGPNDWCETFVVDDHFQWFMWRNRAHAPKWFDDAIERVEYFPEPLVVAA